MRKDKPKDNLGLYMSGLRNLMETLSPKECSDRLLLDLMQVRNAVSKYVHHAFLHKRGREFDGPLTKGKSHDN